MPDEREQYPNALHMRVLRALRRFVLVVRVAAIPAALFLVYWYDLYRAGRRELGAGLVIMAVALVKALDDIPAKSLLEEAVYFESFSAFKRGGR